MPRGRAKVKATTAATSREHSVKATRDLLKKLDQEIEPPIPLDDDERQVFDGFLVTRPAELWSFSDLKNLAQLSKISCQLDRAQEVLDEEGFILEDSRGRSYEHPISGVQAKLVSAYRTLSMVLRLSIGNIAKEDKPDAEQKKEDRAERAVREAAEAMLEEGDGLLGGWAEEEDDEG